MSADSATSNESFVLGAFSGLRDWRPSGEPPSSVSDYHWRAGFLLGTMLQVAVVLIAFLASLPVVGI